MLPTSLFLLFPFSLHLPKDTQVGKTFIWFSSFGQYNSSIELDPIFPDFSMTKTSSKY